LLNPERKKVAFLFTHFFQLVVYVTSVMESTRKNLAIAQLISRQLTGHITAAELLELQVWRKEDPVNEALWQQLTDPGQLEERITQLGEPDNRDAFAQLMQRIYAEDANPLPEEPTLSTANRSRTRLLLRYAAIALPLLVAVAAGWYFFGFYRTGTHAPVATRQQTTPLPPSNGTTADR
jgi:ferric-dicitrate binding protein FerR (iron transport regulator)